MQCLSEVWISCTCVYTSPYLINIQVGSHRFTEYPSYPAESRSFQLPVEEEHCWPGRTDSLDSTDTERDGVRQAAQKTGVKDRGGAVQMAKADSASSGAEGMDTPTPITLGKALC